MIDTLAVGRLVGEWTLLSPNFWLMCI